MKLTRSQSVALVLVSASCLYVAVLPQAVQTDIKYVEKPRPRMFVDCALPAVEYGRICRGRVVSERIGKTGKRL